MKERINPHALDHLTHLWQYFRNSEEHRQATDAIREVTGRNPQTLEEFFRANAKFYRRRRSMRLLYEKYGMIYIIPSTRRPNVAANASSNCISF